MLIGSAQFVSGSSGLGATLLHTNLPKTRNMRINRAVRAVASDKNTPNPNLNELKDPEGFNGG